MYEAFDHPDPDWTPLLDYGAPIPMKWVRVGPGLWFVWPPRQFCTTEPDGLNTWRNDNGRDNAYKPDRPSSFASTKPLPPEYGSLQKPLKWLDHHPASWGGYPDGRTMVILGDFEITFDRTKVRFNFARSFSGRELGYYHPAYIENPPTITASNWASSNFGPLSPPSATERLWHYPTSDGRRWVGTFHIEQNEVEFSRCDVLPPPILPTDKEVAAEKDTISKEKEVHGDLWPLSQMIRDLAKSDEFLELIREDEFAQQFRLFFLNNDVVHLHSGKTVRVTTDDTGAWILADLRCYREHWQACSFFPKEGENAKARDTIVRLFAEVGYAPFYVEFDETAHLAKLGSIWETMPAKLKQAVLNEQGKVHVLMLAWAMGEFWSSEDGWKVVSFPAEDEIHLKGGHLPDAIQIARMFEEGQLSGSAK